MREERGVTHEYRVCIDIPEGDEWEAQQLVTGWDSTLRDAREYARSMDLSAYPKGTRAFVESRTISDWKEVD